MQRLLLERLPLPTEAVFETADVSFLGVESEKMWAHEGALLWENRSVRGLPAPLNEARFYVTEFATRYFEYPWVVGLVGAFVTNEGLDFRAFLSPNFTSATHEVEDFLFGSCTRTFDERVDVARAAASLTRLGHAVPPAFLESGMCVIVPVEEHEEFATEIVTKFSSFGTVEGVREFRIRVADDRAYQTRFCSEPMAPTWLQDRQAAGLCEATCDRACNAGDDVEQWASASDAGASNTGEGASDAGATSNAPPWISPRESCLHTCHEGWDDARTHRGGACREEYLSLYACLSSTHHSCTDDQDPFFSDSCSTERSALNVCQSR